MNANAKNVPVLSISLQFVPLSVSITNATFTNRMMDFLKSSQIFGMLVLVLLLGLPQSSSAQQNEPSTNSIEATQESADSEANIVKSSTGADGPGECARLFYEGLLNGDQAAMFQVALCRTKLDRTASRAIVRFGGAADKFRTKFVAAYGKEAWQKFNDDNHLPYEEGASSAGNGSLTIMERDAIAPLVQEAIDNATDKGSFTSVPNSEQKLKLVLRNGRWFALYETLTGETDPEAIRNLANFMGKLAVEVERLHHAIGQPGISADDIDYELGVIALVSMGAKGFDNVPHRFDVDKLPDPQPFEAIGELSLVPELDLETLAQYQKSGKQFANAFFHEDANQFVAKLAPKLRPLVDPQEIAKLRERVKSAFGEQPFTIEIANVDFDQSTGHRVSGTVEAADKSFEFLAFEVNDEWTGLTIKSDSFGVDTRNLTLAPKSVHQKHVDFFSALFDHKLESAYEVFSPGEPPKGEEYDDFIQNIPDGTKWISNEPLIVRAAVVEGEMMLRVYSDCSIVLNDEKARLTCVSEYQDIDGEWSMYSYRYGRREDRFVLNDFSAQETLFRALGNGDAETLRNLFPEKSRNEIRISVVSVYCEQFQERYGKFQSINYPEYISEAVYSQDQQQVVATGKVVFERGELQIRTGHFHQQLVSFGFEGDASRLEDFASRIKDVSELDALVQSFWDSILTGPSDVALGLMVEGLREKFGEPASFEESLGVFREANGKVKSMKLDRSGYSKETGVMTLDYTIQCEKRELSGKVGFEFSAIGCEIVSFTIQPVVTEPPSQPSESNEGADAKLDLEDSDNSENDK